MPPPTDAASLLRSIGLMADGPTVWGRPVPAAGPGVFVVELPAPVATAPIELTRVGKWIERVETLRLDGERPTSKALAARLGSFWLPSQRVVYIGASEVSVARRIAAIGRTELGDRRPYHGGHWLHALRSLDGVRVWWATTDATEEYEDALFTAFAEGVSANELAALPDREVVLPWAALRRPTGERKATGLTGSLLPDHGRAAAASHLRHPGAGRRCGRGPRGTARTEEEAGCPDDPPDEAAGPGGGGRDADRHRRGRARPRP